MAKIYNFGKPATETITAGTLTNKKVIDTRGKEVGRVKSLHLDPEELTLEGIKLDKGLFNGKDYIGKEYIASIAGENVLLSITPLSEYLDMKVYDKEGQEIGKVRDVNRARKTNHLYSITIERGKEPDLVVHQDFIDTVGENIVLKTGVEA